MPPTVVLAHQPHKDRAFVFEPLPCLLPRKAARMCLVFGEQEFAAQRVQAGADGTRELAGGLAERSFTPIPSIKHRRTPEKSRD